LVSAETRNTVKTIIRSIIFIFFLFRFIIFSYKKTVTFIYYHIQKSLFQYIKIFN
jgi:hypothetical protein